MLRTVISILTMIVAIALIVPFLLILSPIWLFVSLCKALENLLKPTGTTWNKMVKYDPELGWRPRPDMDQVIYHDQTGDVGSMTTNEEGWPCSYSISESDVVVFGDSFAFGYGSYMEDTYYGLSDEIRIKPIAAPGYNMVQALILMKQNREKLRKKLIVLFICLENDLAENLKMNNSIHYTMPFVKKNCYNGNWEIFTSHIQPFKWLYSDRKSYNELRFANICTPSVYSDKVFSACNYLIREAEEICSSVGAELIVFSIPDKEQLTKEGVDFLKKFLKNPSEFNVDLPDIKIKEICDELHIPFIPGKQYLNIEDYKVRDGHWNKKGNKKVSNIIHDYYNKKRSTIRRVPYDPLPESGYVIQ